MRGICSMASRVFPLRASDVERKRWQARADAAGRSFNRWARDALNRVAELEEALGRERLRGGRG